MASQEIKFLLECFIEQQEILKARLGEQDGDDEEEDDDAFYETEATDYVYSNVEEEKKYRIPNFDDWD